MTEYRYLEKKFPRSVGWENNVSEYLTEIAENDRVIEWVLVDFKRVESGTMPIDGGTVGAVLICTVWKSRDVRPNHVIVDNYSDFPY